MNNSNQERENVETGDRISDLYKGQVFAVETQSVGKQRIHWMCQRVEGQKVLDIGCSQGIVSILLGREGFEVVGVDVDAAAIQYANSDREKEPPEVQQRLNFIRGDIYSLDLAGHEFHTAIMAEFLEHLVKPDKAIARAYELLVDEGTLIVTTPFGLFEDPDHKQTFYMASLHKLIYPHFVVSEVDIIGKYLCLACKKRKTAWEEQIDRIELPLIEREEREIERREIALTREAKELEADLNTTRAELHSTMRETTRLRAELTKEQRTLQKVRASLSFQLGSMLVQAVRKPGRNTILLPYRVLRLGIDAFGKGRLAKAPGTSGRKPYVLETVKGRINEIKREMGTAPTGSVEPRRKDLKIAVIMDEIFYELFKYEANLITFTPDNWKQVLSEERPDVLLIDSAWHGNNDTWKYLIDNLKQKPTSKLPEVVAWCKSQGIPTAFWNREDPPHYDEFLDTARLFDYVFTSDADCIERYKKDLGHNNIYCLTFAAQPRIHNPVGSARKLRDVGFAGSWYVRHSERIKQMEYVLKPALEHDVDIYDRYYTLNNDRYRFPEEYRPNIVGELEYDEMIYAYKVYKLFLNVNSIPESPTMFAMRVLEILASGSCVLSGYSKAVQNLIGSDIVKMSSSPEETRLYLRQLLENKELRDRLAHLGLRKVMKEHTYEKRLDYILQTMGIRQSGNGTERKGVSVITCTNKSEYVDSIFANYDRQQYEDKELIIILNSDGLNLEEWREKAKSYPDVTVYQVDETEPLGVCLNYGIEKAKFDYISKFDDDDYYGPAFLEDLMNAFEYTDADIVGKCASYIYFENGNTLALYGESREHSYTDLVLGPTMIVKREVFDRVPWPTDRRQGSDSEFLRRSVKNGFKIYSADRFNYVYMRRSSSGLHTWQVRDEEQLANCRTVCHTKDYTTHVAC